MADLGLKWVEMGSHHANFGDYFSTTDKPADIGGNPLKALAPLGDLDANIELRAGALTMNEQQIKKLHALVGLAGGVLTIEDLSVGDLMGGKGAMVRSLDELRAAANEWIANPGPMVIDCRISRTVMSIPYRRLHYGKDE